MQRTKAQYNVVSLPATTDTATPGYFSKGNPITGAKATLLTADFFNMIQEELVGLVIGAGLTPDAADNTQVLDAVNALIDSRRAVLQDFTVVGNIGDSLQQRAGRVWTKAEIETRFGAANVLAHYRFGAGAALVTDEQGTYGLTLGAGAAAPANTNGIMGTAFAAAFDSNQYATIVGPGSVSLLESMAGITDLAFILWIKPSDGQPAGSQYLFTKSNDETVGALKRCNMYISTSGKIVFEGFPNCASGAQKIIETNNAFLPDGAQAGYRMVCGIWSTTYGLMLFVDNNLKGVEASATTLMGNGTARDFIIGGSNVGGAFSGGYAGNIAQFIVLKTRPTQQDINWLHATAYARMSQFTDDNYKLTSFIKDAVAGNPRQGLIEEVERDSSYVYVNNFKRLATQYQRIEVSK